MGGAARITVDPKRSLGQNFLVDDNIARKIVRELRLAPGDVVLEIGPGQGALTPHLAEAAGRLIAVEIDQRVVGALRERFASDRVTILGEDFLEVGLEALSRQHGSALRVVGNIPYHLTSAILFKVFEEHRAVRDLTVMVQREVARRIVAGPGTKEYGILSLFCRFYGTPRLLFDVSENCFYPKPNVTSTVLQVAMHGELPGGVDASLFGAVVRTAFGKRRKTLRNSLKYLPYEESVLRELEKASSVALDRRAEELSLEEFLSLTKDIERLTA